MLLQCKHSHIAVRFRVHNLTPRHPLPRQLNQDDEAQSFLFCLCPSSLGILKELRAATRMVECGYTSIR